MLTKHPNIVIALPPKRAARRKRAAALHANQPRVVDAQKPRPHKQAKAAPILTSRIVDHSKPSPLEEVDHEAAGAAADRLWQEIVQRVKAAAPEPGLPSSGKTKDQPALGRKNSRDKSGQ